MSAYYNENDPFAAAWLRELIKANHISPGDVDERSIEDVLPRDLAGYTQCHFFAGIGVWSYALRQAGWPDDRPVWTGSCPCQPFSTAGKGGGFYDKRHLWPAFHHLLSQCRPDVVFGEQVASKDGMAWLDLVHADLESTGYAVGAVDTCAASFGAPHIRQRLYWVGHSNSQRLEGHGSRYQAENERCKEIRPAFEASNLSWVANPDGSGLQSRCRHDSIDRYGDTASTTSIHDGGLLSSTNGFWRTADWLCCQDNKWRSVEPGTFPLVAGTPARVGRLRGYGNAIIAPQAEAFISAYMEWGRK